MKTYYRNLEFSQPIGIISITSDGINLTGLYMENHRHGPDIAPEWISDPNVIPFTETARQLEAYFAGDLTEFDLPFDLIGTEFQKTVWDQLTQIPYGLTISYGELARRVGNPNASRAVGLANGRNPVSIIVPCHRVIGTSGKLVGYGGGLDRKQWLLAHETVADRTLELPL